MWVVLVSSALAQSTLAVDPLAGPYFTVAAALAEAAPGDVIEIAPGNYAESLRVVVDDLTIRGLSRTEVILEAGDRFEPGDGFLVADRVTLRLEELTLSGGGGARAMRSERSDVTFVGVDLVDGGMYGNGALLFGDAGSSLTLRDVLLAGGDAGSGGGGLVAVDGVFDAVGVRFRDGLTSRKGGALYCGPTSTCSVQDSEFVANQAGDGGAVYLQGTPGAWRRNVYCMNDAVGGVSALGRGGAVWSDAEVVHENSVFQGNRARNAGGALFVEDGRLDVVNSDLLGNASFGDGAAIASEQPLLIDVRNSLIAFSDGTSSTVVRALVPSTDVEYSAFFENGDMASFSGPLSKTNQPPDVAQPRIRYDAEDCLATRVRPAPRSSLVDAGDPAIRDPDDSRSDIGSTGGPWACNRSETPGNELDEDCDGRELCYADLDGDGFGEPDASPVVSEDLDCHGEGEADNADDVCVGYDDALDCDADGIPDGCDVPCRTLGNDDGTLPDPVISDRELVGGPGCGCSTASPLPWSAALLLVVGLLGRRRRG